METSDNLDIFYGYPLTDVIAQAVMKYRQVVISESKIKPEYRRRYR